MTYVMANSFSANMSFYADTAHGGSLLSFCVWGGIRAGNWACPVPRSAASPAIIVRHRHT